MMIRRLRYKWRKATIAMLTKESYRPLLNGIPGLDERLYYPEDKHSRRSFRRNLKQSGYDTVIDLQNNIVSRALTTTVKPRSIYRYHRSRINRWMRIHFPKLRNCIAVPLPVALGYLSVVYRYGIFDKGISTELVVSDQWRDAVDVDVSDALMIAPGARHATKMWSTAKWIELLKSAYSAGMVNQVILGGSDEVGLADQIAGAVDHPVTVTAGKTGLGELTAIIESGSVLVTGDSGPMHIAAAVGTPVVAIFGSTVPEFGFAPFRCEHELIQVDDLDCRPCHPHGLNRCPKGHFKCMEDIEVEPVIEATKRLAHIEAMP